MSTASVLARIGTAPVAVANASDITAVYAAKFGNPPVPGSKVFIAIQQTTGGFDGPEVIFTAIIPEDLPLDGSACEWGHHL